MRASTWPVFYKIHRQRRHGSILTSQKETKWRGNQEQRVKGWWKAAAFSRRHIFYRSPRDGLKCFRFQALRLLASTLFTAGPTPSTLSRPDFCWQKPAYFWKPLNMGASGVLGTLVQIQAKKVLAEGWTTRRSTCCLQELSRPRNGPHPELCKTLPEAQLPGSLFLWVGRGI